MRVENGNLIRSKRHLFPCFITVLYLLQVGWGWERRVFYWWWVPDLGDGGGGGRGLVKNVNFHEWNTHRKGRRFRIVLYASLPIVRKVDSSIHGMNLYPLDSAIHLLNNRGLVNKGLFIRPKRNIFLRANAGSPEWARWVHLARWGSQSEHIFRFILPAHEFCHIIGTVKIEVTPQVHFA